MNRSNARTAFVWLLVGLGLLMLVMLVRLYAAQADHSSLLDVISGLESVASLLAFMLSGAVILVRQPGNPIGWLLMIPGLTAPAADLTSRWLGSLQPPPTELTPVLWLLVWFSGWSWVLLIFPIFHLLLVFPTGHLVSPCWRLVVGLEIAMVTAMLLLAGLGDTMGPLVAGTQPWTAPNPIGVLAADVIEGPAGIAWYLALLLLTGLGALAIAIRFRHGGFDERQQLKWPVFGALVFGLVYAVGIVENAVTGQGAITSGLLGFALAAIPVTVAIAVLRYRLYEIDRIVSRTIGWALVTGILLSTFGLLVVGLQALLQGVTQGGTLVVAASTLAAASLFQPVRGRVQQAVDRRFDRARYDGERVVTMFGERLREQVELDALSGEIRRVADETVRPATTALWLRAAKIPQIRQGS